MYRTAEARFSSVSAFDLSHSRIAKIRQTRRKGKPPKAAQRQAPPGCSVERPASVVPVVRCAAECRDPSHYIALSAGLQAGFFVLLERTAHRPRQAAFQSSLRVRKNRRAHIKYSACQRERNGKYERIQGWRCGRHRYGGAAVCLAAGKSSVVSSCGSGGFAPLRREDV